MTDEEEHRLRFLWGCLKDGMVKISTKDSLWILETLHREGEAVGEECDKLEAERDAARAENARLAAECEKLRAALSDAADGIEFWGAYASEYFQKGRDLVGDVRRAREALGSAP